MVKIHLSGYPKRLLILAAVLTLSCTLALAGCGSGGDSESVEAQANLDEVLAKGIKPNEMGMVMVLEYHRIDDEEGNFVRSVDNFKKDLETLYDKGYRLVSFSDLMKGRIDVPAGTTPVVFSFDDSTESEIRYLPDGSSTKLDPKCALGMMEEFDKKHEDFGYTALFNVLPDMFGQEKYKKKKLEYLTKNGFEIGNHTASHALLGKLTDEQVQKEIATLQKEVTSLEPTARVNVLCLPYGSLPANQALIFDGSYEGTKYHNNYGLLVGSNPFYPVWHYKNPGKLIPRIQVMDYDPDNGAGAEGSAYWLRYFEKHPENRFISDGSEKTVCAPSYMSTRVLPDQLPKGVTFVGY